MGKCKWKPPTDSWGADEYEGCPHESHTDSDNCIFHISLEEKRKDPTLAEEFTKAFDAFFEGMALKPEAGDFVGFEFPDSIGLSKRDFLRAHERKQFRSLGHKSVSFSLAIFGDLADFRETRFGDEADFGKAIFGNEADFGKAKFGDTTNFAKAKFGDRASFYEAKFGDWAGFHEAKFGDGARFVRAKLGEGAIFVEAKFGDRANFWKTKFGDRANFGHAKFGNKVYFREAKFGNEVHFNEAEFGDLADLRGANFGYNIIFWQVLFGDQVDLKWATFGDRTDFGAAKFGDRTDFGAVKFGDHTNFKDVVFGEQTDFNKANFGNWAKFTRAEFGDWVDYTETVIGDGASFEWTTFPGKVCFSDVRSTETAFIFSDARLEESGELDGLLKKPSSSLHLLFRETKFEGPAIFQEADLSRVRFELVDLRNLSFFKSKISQTEFVSCRWGSGPEGRKYWHRTGGPIFRFKRPRLLLDELLWRKKNQKEHGPVPLLLRPFAGFWKLITYIEPTPEVIGDMEPPDDLQAEDIEILGLQLKQSLEATKDPITAGDFHFCVMEMKLEKARAAGRFWRKVGLTLYKFINGYGERYARTLMWLALLVAISTLLFAWQGETLFEGYKSFSERLEPAFFWACQHILPFKFGTELWKIDVHDSAMRWLTMGETFFGSTLFAFMILAMRRRFKR